MKNNILITITVLVISTLFCKMAFAQTQPVKLLCVNETTNNQIEIIWELTGPPCGASFERFDIYVTNNLDAGFQFLASVMDESRLSYLDGTSINNPDLNGILYYYIVNICGSNPSARSEILDNRLPEFPSIEYVTVNDETVEISWQPSASPEAAGYIIFYSIDGPGGGFTPLDTVSPANNTYIHQANAADPDFIVPNPTVNAERYTVATVDACDFGGLENTLPHKTMLLNAQTMACSNTVVLNWNHYEGWRDGIDHYELYGSINGEATSVLNNNIDAGVNAYTYVNDLPQVDELCFQIKAFRYGDLVSSASNDTCVSLADASGNVPAYLFIRYVTVLDNGSVEIFYDTDNSVYVETIKYESGSNSDNIDAFYSQFVGRNLPAEGSYIHVTSETINRAIFYRIEVEDSCGNPIRTGEARTIHLQGKADGNQTNYLTWTGYGNFESAVNEYFIYRQNPVDGSFTKIGEVDNATVQFSDDVQDIETNENGQVCYKVEAKVSVHAIASEIFSSSNIVCISQPARITVPNAFAPEGINNVFIPYTLNVDPTFYEMVIFNRWGGVVFETNNPGQGWDGTYQGRIAQEGVYMYNFTYAGSDGDQKQKKGSVILLR